MAATRSSEFGDLVQIKKQLISITAQCKERGLVHSVKWPLCRYDLLLKENKDVTFRPIPCEDFNF